VIAALPFRVRRIFYSHFGGHWSSLFRGTELIRMKRDQLQRKSNATERVAAFTTESSHGALQ
jgi:hypothetical protein